MTGSTLTDPRSRTKVYVDTYFTAANVTDDNSVAVTWMCCFDEAEYPLEMVFLSNYRDVVIGIGEPSLEIVRNADKTVSSYKETIPINVYLIDKYGLTATKVKWKVEAELRRIAETYIIASVREIRGRTPETRFINGERLHAFTYQLEYTRDIT